MDGCRSPLRDMYRSRLLVRSCLLLRLNVRACTSSIISTDSVAEKFDAQNERAAIKTCDSAARWAADLRLYQMWGQSRGN